MKKTAHESAHLIGHNPYSFLGLFCAWIDPDIQMTINSNGGLFKSPNQPTVMD